MALEAAGAELEWSDGGPAADLSPYVVEAARPWGCAVQLRSQAFLNCPPRLLWAVLTNADNCGVLTGARLWSAGVCAQQPASADPAPDRRPPRQRWQTRLVRGPGPPQGPGAYTGRPAAT